jgi:hypothetical protein
MAQTTFTVWNETQINAAIQAIGADAAANTAYTIDNRHSPDEPVSCSHIGPCWSFRRR